MSEKTDKVASLMQRLHDSEEGKHVMAWIDETANDKRRKASKLEPIAAWGELRFADGLEEVVTQINQLRSMAKER